MSTHLNNQGVVLSVFAAVAILTLALWAMPALATSPFDIEFPIPELGNCVDKTACKQYCDNETNADACHTFAARHGLGASRAEVDTKFKQIEEDGGPGGCARDTRNPNLACKRYCDNASHIEECIDYAKRHGLMEREELREAEKVVAALKRGVQLPPQCENAQSCKEVCEDPTDIKTARACFEFGKEAGLLPPGVSVEQAEKAFAAIESGTGPFKSFAEMRQCDNPPSDEVMDKCIAFALEAGFLPPEEAEMIRKTGGRGPGGCRGRACETFCENPANQETCFAFAEEHGLFREEDRAQMREGIGHMREAIEGAPPEVLECIRRTIPDLDAILAGEKLPSPSIGEKMPRCFDEFFNRQMEEEKRMRAEQGSNDEGYGRFDPRYEGSGERGRFDAPLPMPEGMPPTEYRQEFERQHQDEFQKQFEGQYQQEFERQYQEQYPEQYRAEFERRAHEYTPQEYQNSGEHSETGDYQPPPQFLPPPDGASEPSHESTDITSFLLQPNEEATAAIWDALRRLKNR